MVLSNTSYDIFFPLFRLHHYEQIGNLISTFLCRNIQNIVAPNERIAVFIFQLPICILFGLIQRNIHVTVQTCQNTCE